MVKIKFKLLFFDKPAVMRAVSEASRKILSKFGAFVRTSAKSSIRQSKSASKPGEPPHSHSGLLKRFIFFGYDTAQASVVVGGERLTGRNKGEAPSILEHGGTANLMVLSKSERKRYPKGKKIHILPRPYMNPALEKNIDLLPAMWRDSVKPA